MTKVGLYERTHGVHVIFVGACSYMTCQMRQQLFRPRKRRVIFKLNKVERPSSFSYHFLHRNFNSVTSLPARKITSATPTTPYDRASNDRAPSLVSGMLCLRGQCCLVSLYTCAAMYYLLGDVTSLCHGIRFSAFSARSACVCVALCCWGMGYAGVNVSGVIGSDRCI